ncbi:nucleoside monophosphate kinase [bacterium]|jgi:adenylate kinase|nr:nucleoside monophosphate kinase [bacterium]
MNKNINKIILMGPQGSGKTTQGDKIAEFLDVDMVVAGNILRKEIRLQTDLGKQIDQVVNTGRLIPNELMINLMFKTIDLLGDDKGFILDGFPRDTEQAEALDLHYPVDKVFNIEISDEVAVHRLEQRRVCSSGHVFHLEYHKPKKAGVCDICQKQLVQRKDDKPETVKKRLAIYHKETSQLLDYYKKQNKLVVFDGEKSIKAVSKDILDYLKNVR